MFGSRSWTDAEAIRDRLALLPAGSLVVHGASSGGGADLIADREARKLGHHPLPMPVNKDDRDKAWSMGRPRMAPILRNVRMVAAHRNADLAIGFWDGRSSGSRYMREECGRCGIPVEIVSPRHAGVIA